MKRYYNLFLALATGILLWAAWPVSPFTFLVFIAWVPLLWMEERVASRKKFFGLVYISMLVWNIATTWWVANASLPGALGAFFANSFIMCFPWLGFKIAKKWLGILPGYISLIAFWMCFEYIHLQDWGLSWPWLTLGNVFATHPAWIQWYRFTGTSGGTLWVLVVNVFLFLHIKNNVNRTVAKSYNNLVAGMMLLVLPILVSFLLPKNKYDGGTTSNIVLVQPNVDPYEKVRTGSFDQQIHQLIHYSESQIDENTALVVWPETALFMGNGIEENKMKDNFFLNPLWGFLQRHPNISLFTGIESYREFTDSSAKNNIGYEAYNGAVLLDSSGTLAYYHKSKLVPGVETLPWFLRFIDKWFEKFGGTTAGYTKQSDRTPVIDTKHGYKIAPAICYESIYGEFMSKYVHNGANLICIITNDGWWGNTPGYKQHMNYGRLRAIETGMWVARSANTGISCFIDPNGNIIDPQPWDQGTAIKFNIPVSSKRTFFVKYGDLLSKLMIIISIGILVWGIKLWAFKKFSKKNIATG